MGFKKEIQLGVVANDELVPIFCMFLFDLGG
jgi:hypothetical protein